MFPFNGGPPSGEGILVHWGQPRSVLHAILFPPKQFFSSWLRGRSEPGTFSLSESSSDCCLVPDQSDWHAGTTRRYRADRQVSGPGSREAVAARNTVKD